RKAQQATRQTAMPEAASHDEDWGEVPAISSFYGRQQEVDALRRWLLEDHCRLVAVLGMGGMGKTSVVVSTAKAVADHFEFVFWRSLVNTPPLGDLLQQALQLLSRRQLTQLPTTLNEQIK